MAETERPEPGPPDSKARGRGRRGSGRNRQLRLRLGGVAALVLVGLVFVIQNSAAAEIRLGWWSVRMPLVFVLVAMIALGVGLDRLWMWRRHRN